jgi:hypothetical protein
MIPELLATLSVGLAALSAGAAAVITTIFVIEALRAKIRARILLHRKSIQDEILRDCLIRLSRDEKLSAAETVAAVDELEARLNDLSDRDRYYIKQGLHQNSSKGVERFAKELATAY